MLTRSHNVQAVVPASTHKVLKDVAYFKGVSLRDLLRAILMEYAVVVSQDALNNSVPSAAESQKEGEQR
jgi:hypothetical protein